MPEPFRVGVDIGGTFTDIIFIRDGRLRKMKVPSTPPDYSVAIVEALQTYLKEENVAGKGLDEIVHATTVATNAILERKGAKTALLTTDGFRDVLELRRTRIPLLYDLWWKKPEALVERALRFGVVERMNHQGQVQTALDADSLAPIAAEIADAGVEAVAVCFLHSYRNAAHEREAAAFLRRALPNVHLSLSCDVLPEIMEYERTSTTVVNAYVAPLIERYLGSLRDALVRLDVDAPILIMQSNGGLISAQSVVRRPVTIIESGPAAGVVAAANRGVAAGYPNVITLDMGGTTTKASLIERGETLRAPDYEVGATVSVSSRLIRGAGYILRIPAIDVSEVGAGGGSIASVDPDGGLRVGPRSAGAVPGPVCYGRGNEDPTVTDANLVLGYLNPVALVGGALRIDRDRAAAAIAKKIAEPLGLSLLEAAHGIHAIANSNMVRAIKSVSVERGRDPADFVIMAFGGNGPVHAAGLAHSLEVKRVVVPPAPGLFSAVGLLQADVEHHAIRTILTRTRGMDYALIRRTIDELRSELAERIREEGSAADRTAYEVLFDLRYGGQTSEITVPVRRDTVDEAAVRLAEEEFETEFERMYGHRGTEKDFELVNCRVVATVPRNREFSVDWSNLDWTAGGNGVRGGSPARDVYFGPELGSLSTPILTRDMLGTEPKLGPFIVEEYDSTIVVPPGCRVSADEHANVVIDL